MTFASTTPEISLAPQSLFHVGPLVITNSQVLGTIGVLILLALLARVVVGVRNGSRSRLVHAVVWLFENLYDTTVEVLGDKKTAQKVLPLAVTLMLFFMINNWLGILPIVGSVSWHGHELFRGVAADLNTTLALAIISMTTVQIWAIKRRGFFGNLGRYIHNPIKDPMHAFEGVLELLAEFSRTAALAFRIFGNVFGGEVLLSVIAFLTSFAAPIALPLFYCLELFVGAVQAYVFFMLTIAFISLGLPSSEDAHGNGTESESQAMESPAQ